MRLQSAGDKSGAAKKAVLGEQVSYRLKVFEARRHRRDHEIIHRDQGEVGGLPRRTTGRSHNGVIEALDVSRGTLGVAEQCVERDSNEPVVHLEWQAMAVGPATALGNSLSRSGEGVVCPRNGLADGACSG